MFSPTADDDKILYESWYAALLKYFCQSFEPDIQKLLQESYFALVADSTGIRTFFMVASSQSIAEELTEHIKIIIKQVNSFMPGVKKTGICFVPASAQFQPIKAVDLAQFPPRYMLGKIFSHSNETETLIDQENG